MKERPQSIRWLIAPRFDESGVQISSGIGVDGLEYPDGVPMAPPIGYEAPTQLEQLIEQILRRRDFNAAAEAAGVETFDEADDFEVEDEDYDARFPETIYEAYFEAKSKRAAQRAAQPASAGGSGSVSVDQGPKRDDSRSNASVSGNRLVESPKEPSGSPSSRGRSSDSGSSSEKVS